MIVVFNKHCDPDYSWCDEVVNVMRPNVLGNPFPIAGRNTRDFVIKNYAEFLRLQMMEDTPQRREIERLRALHAAGKNIGLLCCCSPLACHADVIKGFAMQPPSDEPKLPRMK
jgi:hypothetical protein